MKLLKNKLISGTLILTIASFTNRIIGFFYRIYLSQQFGEEGMGIYQLIAPVIALTYSLSIVGIELSITRYIAACNTHAEKTARLNVLKTGLLLALTISLITGFTLFENAGYIAQKMLLEERCSPLIKIFSIALPISAIHSCIIAYYYGQKQTLIPAFSHLVEQIFRIGTVYFICQKYISSTKTPTIAVAVIGIVLGELAASLFCIVSLKLSTKSTYSTQNSFFCPNLQLLRNIVKMAFPLALTRIILNIFQSIEAIYIPNNLLLYGLSQKEALSLYGVLTGMAFPLIFAPSTLTSSLSTLLLPYISEADANNNRNKIVSAFRKCLFGCICLGILCGIFFFTTGNFLGTILFHSEKAGNFIRLLSYICPFLYLGNVLCSILHGLGKANLVFIIQLITLLIRLSFVFLFIPQIGIQGYLTGILVSQLFFCIAIFVALKDYIYYNN